MSYPDIEEVLNYLSTKFNKIFCDREFVYCVTQDFQTILDNKNRCCVLVFPALGPIYLKAVRYQARIFDLAAFSVGTGKLRVVAVCHKEHLLQKPTAATATATEAATMKEEVASSRRKRPERQLYVPPAQRRSRISRPKTDSAKVIDTNDSPSSDEELINLTDLIDIFYNFDLSKCGFVLKRDQIPHFGCEFKRFVNSADSFQWHKCIPIYTLQEGFHLHWETINLNFSAGGFTSGKCSSSTPYQSEICEKEFKPQNAITVNTAENYSTSEENGIFLCGFKPVFCEWDVLDLSEFRLGHFCLIEDSFFECQENHDVQICCANKCEALKTAKTLKENASKEPKAPKSESPIKNVCEHEQEKEIMRKTKENINRKIRPIMKYMDDHYDTLKIGKSDSVNNWEDLFDDEGQVQDELLTEIVEKVGVEVTVVKASEDYSQYTNKAIEELEHVVELYDFPSTLETHDLVQAFSQLNSDSMYVKWVDDTHALLVLGSLSQAQKAVNMNNPLIKVRPMTAASAISMDVANKSDLKPAMKRPATNLQTARRLITTHLGTKSRLSKEQMAKEKQDLKNAKEMKRLIKQNEKDAWEGNLRSSVK